ncbi:MAG: DNA-directed RNA polymerase [Candidatus Altiarchaeota archaeon]
MYKIVTLKDTVRVPPRRFEENLTQVIKSELMHSIVGSINKEVGILLSITKVNEVGEGRIILGDGAIYYDVVFDVLTHKPTLHEVVEGIVSEMTEFGAFVTFGPLDGLIHVSQVTEDFMRYDQGNNMLVGKESNKTLKVGDLVRARVVAVSLKDNINDSKIGLTMRQPYLGKLEWIESERVELEKKKEEGKESKEKEKPPESKKNKKAK